MRFAFIGFEHLKRSSQGKSHGFDQGKCGKRIHGIVAPPDTQCLNRHQ